MAGGWDGSCGGGVWWDKARTYKNAIANEIFLDVAALLHNRTPGDRDYGRWAAREWRWFRGSGMLTRSGLVVDGLDHCRPILGSPTWTYNQGVLIGGLVALSEGSGDPAPLRTARNVAAAVIGSGALSPGGILREPCEQSECGLDTTLFKGIFVANLKTLYDRAPRPAYQAYLLANARRLWAADRDGSDFGLHWAGPFGGAGVPAQVAALYLLDTQAG
jgi:predicted alpha-1,6-mannanase (GH76 family)